MKGSVAIVMGGGVNNDGTPPLWVQDRLAALKSTEYSFDFIILSSRYTMNVPPKVSSDGFIINEAKSMFDALPERLKQKCFLELSSTDTIGSVMFSFNMLENLELNNYELKIFSSDFHINRVKLISEWYNGISLRKSDIGYIGAKSSRPYTSRWAKEVAACKNFQEEWLSINNKTIAWKKLFTDHSNYNTANASANQARSDELY